MNLPICLPPSDRLSQKGKNIHQPDIDFLGYGATLMPACCVETCIPTPLGSVCTCLVGGCD